MTSAMDVDGKEKDFKNAVRASRRLKIQPITTIEAIQFIVAPDYTAADDARAGGCRSTAVLGPAALLSANSDSVAALPAAITAVRAAYTTVTFVSGHLLNAELGGAGDEPANLAILTSAANSAHKNFDNRIKDAVTELKKAYQAIAALGVDVTSLDYGISVDISTSGAYWDADHPGSCVTTGLTCFAIVADEPDLEDDHLDEDVTKRVDGWRNKLTAATASMAKVQEHVAAALANGDIDNTE